MRKIFCDKCGKETQKPVKTFISLKHEYGFEPYELTGEPELCSECAEEIQNQINVTFRKRKEQFTNYRHNSL